ncbi:FAD-linked oxidase C-terminal domain-containing protein [Blastococcus sp. BMG 814]|uniref:FAD-linked oxidase C-terminal domain-containing protein n=1 Tax=Blastococcus carthaginiensis TaxID=3050034 RepID=A0ABT9I7Z4_9ACTN|nr:FAD-binding and (Fe-S)-binding domain-containing protein [Blastococcus carthaginiensis]MDP5181673.1 FAD-linked oxidase C-terminal domain-containing protein [Blastococcus carthaginiensis]
MTSVDLPAPVVRPPEGAGPAAGVDVTALERDLRARVDGEVRFDAGSRGAYSTDASNYRQVPIGVVVPSSVDAAAEAVAVCRDHGAPVLSRGGGTSLAGECTNTAVVLDFSKYCTRLVSVDPEARTCVVEPGIVLDRLNAQLEEHGLEFGPEPATHNHCTIGGMIGNNACGATAQRTGKVVDNIVSLDVLLYDGTRMTVGATSDAEYAAIVQAGGRRGEVYRQLRELADRYGEQVRRRYPDIPRRVSGYNLQALLPEKGFDLARALIGSENTLVTVLRAELRLVPVVEHRALVLLGYPDVAASARDVPAIVEHQPIALEGLDRHLIGFQQTKDLNPDTLALLPEGPRAWLLVQFGGETPDEAGGRAREFAELAGGWESGPTATVFDQGVHQADIWKVREAGLGATARVPGLPDAWPGWEDSAVDPADLADYLTDLQRLYDEFEFGPVSLYGHFGQGCVHTRIPFDLQTAGGVRRFREFIERAADLVVSYGGSFSGEHGDGQARGELLPRMFGDELVEAFGRLKAVFDPGNRMNPGKVVAPYRLDEHLRLGTDYSPAQVDTHFAYPHDDGSFDRAVLRCVGVGRCRRDEGGVMCPSYMVTREEEHSTRGRARLLFEMLQGHADSPIGDGWRSTAVRDSLDLCLACKGCKTDCPVNVDMATYKAEFLSHHYAGRLRPIAHYTLGWLPLVARVAGTAPRVLNALTQAPGLRRIATAIGGVAPEREIPQFADQTFQAWYAAREPRGTGQRGEVVLWPDTFSNSFQPGLAKAAVEVLEDAGWRVVVPTDAVCCGLTWISTGQLDVAKRVLRRTIDVLRPHVQAGTLVLGLEPSCTAVFRSDAAELYPDDPDVQRLRQQTVTLAELLTEHTPGWEPPQLRRRAVVQTHCHQHAVMGFDRDVELMQQMGMDVDVLDSGCCGLAGNFGFERGHYDVSTACAERVLLPELRKAGPEDVVLADGFSCRIQIEQGDAGGREGVHLAEVLAAALRGDAAQPGERPERTWADRPSTPRAASWAALGTVTAVGLGTAGVAIRALRR